MSPSIWTRCEGPTRARRLVADVWRAVEHPYTNSTRALVDSDDEQGILEALIDSVKPAPPRGCDKLHYLLFTPFRHPPLTNGSRFGRRSERAVFYAAKTVETALTEVAYYRLVFLEGTEADLGVTSQLLTVFRVRVSAKRAIDLTSPPFSRYRSRISSPVSYRDSHALGHEMRMAGIEACAFFSARDAEGTNIALFEPAFEARKPSAEQQWGCLYARSGVRMTRISVLAPATLLFPRQRFEVDGALPMPASSRCMAVAPA